MDDEDFELVRRFKWRASKSGKKWYASHREKETGHIYLHQFLMRPSKSLEVDHINGHGLDCQKSNLRICTRAQNAVNIPLRKGKRFRGVHWHKQARKWRAQISANGKIFSLGLFNKEEDAAFAFNKAAVKYRGDFARLNEVISHL